PYNDAMAARLKMRRDEIVPCTMLRPPQEAQAYLDGVRQTDMRDNILTAIERADDLCIAFVGESIVDVYRSVSVMGKPSKEPCLDTTEIGGPDIYSGGVGGGSRHGEWRNVTVV